MEDPRQRVGDRRQGIRCGRIKVDGNPCDDDGAEGARAVVVAPARPVGANEPYAKRLYELTLGAKKKASSAVRSICPAT